MARPAQRLRPGGAGASPEERRHSMALGESFDPKSPDAVQQGLRVLARSMVRELKRAGYSQSEMVRFASEVIDQVSQDFRASTPPDADDAS
jgi:hypothetical protein